MCVSCQDCHGKGWVPLGFFAGFIRGIGANPQQEECRTCQSSNIVRSKEPEQMNPDFA